MATRSKTTTTYGGSEAGEAAGSEWLGWQKDKIQGGVPEYGGQNPFTAGTNEWERYQRNTLGGLQGDYGGPGGRWDTAYGINKGVAGLGADAYNIGNRSGGPSEGYINPYTEQMKGYLTEDYGNALSMMQNRVGAGAGGAGAFGGARHGVAEGVGGAQAQRDYLRAATKIDVDAFDKGMGWQYEDQTLQAKLAMQANQDKYNFGNLNLSATDRMSDIKPQLSLAKAQGDIGGADYYETKTTTDTTETGSGGKTDLDRGMGYLGTAAGMYLAYKAWAAGCIPKGTTIDMANGDKVPIEKIEVGDLVIGMDGKEVEVHQVHQYKQTPYAKFVTITFDNGSKVNCSHDHMINEKRARDYTYHDKIGSRKVTSIVFYMGVERSYDIITTTGGYRIEGIPVNTMIPEMAEKSLALANKIMKAA